ncbi:MAG: hypothetical protein ACT4PT_13480, partial [Methanobacteriota archaeon]
TESAVARHGGRPLKAPRHAQLGALLRKGGLAAHENEVKEWASLYAIRLQESAGLDIVWDGEQQRSEMYHYAAKHIRSLSFTGHVRSFDNKYYEKAAAVEPVSLAAPFHVDELEYVLKHTDRVVKIPITGPYTLMDWSFDETYARDVGGVGRAADREARRRARAEFLSDIAGKVLRPNIQALVDAGATWVQIDEPGVTTKPDEVDLFVDAFNEATRGIDCRFTVHICFSDYSRLFPDTKRMRNFHGYAPEFANRDATKAGVAAGDRPGYHALDQFADPKVVPTVGLGVVDIHRDFVEPATLVRDRILYGVKVLGGPQRVYPSADCGLRTRTWEVSWKKLKALSKGARLAEERLTARGKARRK